MATDYSPLEGLTARGSISHTWLRGRCLVDAGRLIGERGDGQWLVPDPVRHGGGVAPLPRSPGAAQGALRRPGRGSIPFGAPDGEGPLARASLWVWRFIVCRPSRR